MELPDYAPHSLLTLQKGTLLISSKLFVHPCCISNRSFLIIKTIQLQQVATI